MPGDKLSHTNEGGENGGDQELPTFPGTSGHALPQPQAHHGQRICGDSWHACARGGSAHELHEWTRMKVGSMGRSRVADVPGNQRLRVAPTPSCPRYSCRFVQFVGTRGCSRILEVHHLPSRLGGSSAQFRISEVHGANPFTRRCAVFPNRTGDLQSRNPVKGLVALAVVDGVARPNS